MKWTLVVFLLSMSCSQLPSSQKASPEIKETLLTFTITEGISHPESVIYSKDDDALFVSNITSGDPLESRPLGTISKYSRDGKVIAAPWIKGLRAPKGMAIFKNHLYVSDVDQVVKIDLKTAKILNTIKVEGAKFLNDVVADKAGNILISDMMTDTIYVWTKAGVKIWKQTSALNSPNGLFIDGKDSLIIASWGNPIAKDFTTQNPGHLSRVSVKAAGESQAKLGSLQGNLDGIAEDNSGHFWISDWMTGDVFRVESAGSAKKVLNLKQGTADIFFAKELGLLFIPQMYESKVFAYKVI